MSTYEQAREEMFSNAVSVRIYPLDLPDEPMFLWDWHAEIIIPNNQWENSDEDGNFIVTQSGIDAFDSIGSAFEWAYKWLNSRGYDVSNIEVVMKSMATDNGIIKKSDLAKVVEAGKND